ncbi:V-set domain-containing T-cell activation inhibitor 1-like [Girardinichthys multiradiatus]|uniref:V-set domain-containing T-cell activation inhibitor 1-like n=1 Tax=Girardinichthys multiradiatus TaxID=208333 RepID=UPI001FAC50F5|nr:V-set domain-containing T-cell activation inhibitor 1-like [Girardinichthys multiradiatus]
MKVHSRRTLPWMFLLFLVDPGSFQGLVSEGFIGQSVLLPCTSSKSSAVDVFWRDKDDKVLLDIKKGKPDLGLQDLKFKGRVSSFPEEYQKGNFSIIMGNLELGDAGNYECTILIGTSSETIRIMLSVKERNSASCGSTRTNVLLLFVFSALSLMFYV